MADTIDWLQAFIGQTVVIDLAEQHLAIGTLSEVSRDHIALTDADLHDRREANSTKDVYLIETRHIGVRVNRKRVVVPRHIVLAVSRLEDVST